MLAFLRNNTKAIIWFVVIIFALLFGVSSFDLRKEQRFAGEVFGEPVSFQEFRKFEILARFFPPSEDVVTNPVQLRQFIWQQLILAKKAEREGVQVSNEEVIKQVHSFFSAEGRPPITEAQYEQVMARFRISPREFEESLREKIRIFKFLDVKMKEIESTIQADSLPIAESPDVSQDEMPVGEDFATADQVPQMADPKFLAYLSFMEAVIQEAAPQDYQAEEYEIPAKPDEKAEEERTQP